jgi:hypothetical protein
MIVCKKNLSQIGILASTYSNDYNNYTLTSYRLKSTDPPGKFVPKGTNQLMHWV